VRFFRAERRKSAHNINIKYRCEELE